MSVYNNVRVTLSPLIRLIFGIKRSGESNLPMQGGVIVCSNHRSNYDPVILGASLGREMKFMAKIELFKFPPLRWLVTAFGAFPVNRGKGSSAAIETGISIVNDGEILAMFPEGHRNLQGGSPRRFQSGAARIAFKTHNVIVPVAIVTKGRVRPFKRNIVRIGEPLTYDELGFTDGSSDNLHAVSQMLHDKVDELINC